MSIPLHHLIAQQDAAASSAVFEVAAILEPLPAIQWTAVCAAAVGLARERKADPQPEQVMATTGVQQRYALTCTACQPIRHLGYLPVLPRAAAGCPECGTELRYTPVPLSQADTLRLQRPGEC